MKQSKQDYRKSGRGKEAGFTLLETTVAAMIMMVGLLGVMQLFAIAALYNKSSKQTTIASSIAKRQIEQLLSMPIPPAAEPPPLGYGGAIGSAAAMPGYTKNFYVDFDRNGVKGTRQVSEAEWYPGQEASYIATWRVEPDNITANNPLTGVVEPVMLGVRRITVRVDATQAALVGAGGTGGSPKAESAQISTIRSPYQ